MTLRKITIDNSVRYIPRSEQTKDIKPKTKKAGSLSRKQNKQPSQNNKKFLKNISASGFATITKQYLNMCKYITQINIITRITVCIHRYKYSNICMYTDLLSLV